MLTDEEYVIWCEGPETDPGWYFFDEGSSFGPYNTKEEALKDMLSNA